MLFPAAINDFNTLKALLCKFGLSSPITTIKEFTISAEGFVASL